MANISDYDKFDYDYSSYWNKREYEHSAEKNILNKIFTNSEGRWFLDIGGSYGRLTSTYYNQYSNPLILDYSLKTLQRNRDIIRSKYPNVELIAANAYKMPFRNDIFDGAIMVRVLHHIENPKTYFKELKRVMGNDSLYIQEYANKRHIKAIIRALVKMNFDIFSKEPYQQPSANNLEGSKEDQESIFYNFHPQYIKELLLENNFQIKRKYGCSFLRSPLIKKIINDEIMLFLEKIMQLTLSWSNIAPSIFLSSTLGKKGTPDEVSSLKLEDIIVCPSCKNTLLFENEDTAVCKKCSRSYYRKQSIWDFRID
jgi:ubiquinone/menaquinone biosynthesis C-methylase UbiE